MSQKAFKVKHGLWVKGIEVIDSDGRISYVDSEITSINAIKMDSEQIRFRLSDPTSTMYKTLVQTIANNPSTTNIGTLDSEWVLAQLTSTSSVLYQSLVQTIAGDPASAVGTMDSEWVLRQVISGSLDSDYVSTAVNQIINQKLGAVIIDSDWVIAQGGDVNSTFFTNLVQTISNNPDVTDIGTLDSEWVLAQLGNPGSTFFTTLVQTISNNPDVTNIGTLDSEWVLAQMADPTSPVYQTFTTTITNNPGSTDIGTLDSEWVLAQIGDPTSTFFINLVKTISDNPGSTDIGTLDSEWVLAQLSNPNSTFFQTFTTTITNNPGSTDIGTLDSEWVLAQFNNTSSNLYQTLLNSIANDPASDVGALDSEWVLARVQAEATEREHRDSDLSDRISNLDGQFTNTTFKLWSNVPSSSTTITAPTQSTIYSTIYPTGAGISNVFDSHSVGDSVFLDSGLSTPWVGWYEKDYTGTFKVFVSDEDGKIIYLNEITGSLGDLTEVPSGDDPYTVYARGTERMALNGSQRDWTKLTKQHYKLGDVDVSSFSDWVTKSGESREYENKVAGQLAAADSDWVLAQLSDTTSQIFQALTNTITNNPSATKIAHDSDLTALVDRDSDLSDRISNIFVGTTIGTYSAGFATTFSVTGGIDNQIGDSANGASFSAGFGTYSEYPVDQTSLIETGTLQNSTFTNATVGIYWRFQSALDRIMRGFIMRGGNGSGDTQDIVILDATGKVIFVDQGTYTYGYITNGGKVWEADGQSYYTFTGITRQTSSGSTYYTTGSFNGVTASKTDIKDSDADTWPQAVALINYNFDYIADNLNSIAVYPDSDWVFGHSVESLYTPANSSDWSSPAPTSIQGALDRLATLVKTLNSGTGA